MTPETADTGAESRIEEITQCLIDINFFMKEGNFTEAQERARQEDAHNPNAGMSQYVYQSMERIQAKEKAGAFSHALS